jgi:hypothetical protein
VESSSTSDEGKVKMSYTDKYQEYKKFCIANNLQPINFMSFCSLVRRNVLENHKQVLLDTQPVKE